MLLEVRSFELAQVQAGTFPGYWCSIITRTIHMPYCYTVDIEVPRAHLTYQ